MATQHPHNPAPLPPPPINYNLYKLNEVIYYYPSPKIVISYFFNRFEIIKPFSLVGLKSLLVKFCVCHRQYEHGLSTD